jgi:uncharacterized membrane-anchored protein
MNNNIINNFKEIQNEGLQLFIKKNIDYGDAFKDCGLIGILVRINDKIKRMQNITDTSITLINTENLRDTLIDLQNYSTLAILELDKKN